MASVPPNDPVGMDALIHALNAGDYERARDMVRSLIEQQGEKEELLDVYAETLWHTGHPARAVEILLQLAAQAFARGDITRSIGYLKKAYTIDPDHPTIPARLDEYARKALGVTITPEALQRCSLFELLDPEAFQILAQTATWRVYLPGQVIVRMGEQNDHDVFIVLRGTATVWFDTESASVPVGKLEPGDIFGEIGFLTQRPRSATVVAEDRVDVLVIANTAMQALVRQRPEIQKLLEDLYRARMEKTLNILLDRVRKKSRQT